MRHINMLMKRFPYLFILCASILFGCGFGKVDPEKAKAVAEKYLADQKNETYDNIDDYFTPSFNDSEPLASKIEKLNQIKDVLGPIESFELSDTKVTERGLDDPSTVQLTYMVKYAKGTARQIFIIMNEEGKHKITNQNIVTI